MGALIVATATAKNTKRVVLVVVVALLSQPEKLRAEQSPFSPPSTAAHKIESQKSNSRRYGTKRQREAENGQSCSSYNFF